MSPSRRLWVRYRPVAPEAFEAYRRAAAAAGDTARGLGAHFWAFEIEGSAGGCIEFLEGPGDAALESLDRSVEASLRAAGGAEPVELTIGARGLRCSELR